MRKELIWTILFIALLAVIPVKAAPGLVGKWHFDTVTTPLDYPTSPKWTPDSSGLDNHGYLVPTGSEPTLVDGKFLNALSFGGTGYVRVAHSAILSLTAAFTLEAWVYCYSSGLGSLQYILSKDRALGVPYSNYNLLLTGNWHPGNKLALFLYGLTQNGAAIKGTPYWDSGGGGIIGVTSVSADSWHYVVGVYTGSQLSLYVDGVLDSAVPVMGTPSTNFADLWIGNRKYSPGFFKGKIDEVRIWDVALTAEQVKASFDVGSYVFSWLPPLSLEKATYKSGSTIPIKFTVKTSGAFVCDESVKVEVYGPGLGGPLVFSAVYAPEGDTNIRINDLEGLYIVNWHLEDTSAGETYTIIVLFRDTPLGSIVVNIK